MDNHFHIIRSSKYGVFECHSRIEKDTRVDSKDKSEYIDELSSLIKANEKKPFSLLDKVSTRVFSSDIGAGTSNNPQTLIITFNGDGTVTTTATPSVTPNPILSNNEWASAGAGTPGDGLQVDYSGSRTYEFVVQSVTNGAGGGGTTAYSNSGAGEGGRAYSVKYNGAVVTGSPPPGSYPLATQVFDDSTDTLAFYATQDPVGTAYYQIDWTLDITSTLGALPDETISGHTVRLVIDNL